MAPFLLAVSHRVKSPWAKPKHPESRTVASPFCKSRKAWFNRIRQFGRRRAASFSNPFLGGAAEEAEAGSNLAILALAAACLRSGSSDDSLFRGGPKEVAVSSLCDCSTVGQRRSLRALTASNELGGSIRAHRLTAKHASDLAG